MGTALFAEAVYLVLLSAGADRWVIRLIAGVALGASMWLISGEAVVSAVISAGSYFLMEAICKLLRELGLSSVLTWATLLHGVAVVSAGAWLIQDTLPRGIRLGAPYPAFFVISAFWVPLEITRWRFSQNGGTFQTPATPSAPLVITSVSTFITMMVQGYALLPFAALAGYLMETEIAIPQAYRHATALTCSLILGLIANELSFRLSL
ncbi:MAG: hypothetical protein V2G42_01830 [bacterium JZ-2024 1]